MYFLYFVIISPWKRRVLHLNKIESPSPEDAEHDRMASLVEIGPVALEKTMKMWKVHNNANDDNDSENDGNGQSEKLTWAFGSAEQ